MAIRHIEQTIDDLDGSVLEEGEGTRIVFSLEGRTYEIDLSASNAEKFRSAFAPYVDAARSVRSAGTGRARRSSPSKSDVDLSAVREWARANGHTVSDRGRVAAPIVEAWKDATS
ncbi:Lsr2 family protein [Microbacterium testaceum]|uniref:Lsr2 family protein n=1 Tax=Microbacterium testaceum TaxID=2033 RepID=A0A4Y3QKD7_MICTE|nr:Lsr2 family protein [Microbacterium testaceum]GEB45734.1 Lsr2 family protein [Microbacterium testaceum]